MRLDDFLNQSISTKNLSRQQKQANAAAFNLAQSQESPSLSETSGGYFSKTSAGESAAKADFKAYMDQAMGRVPQAPKTPEEKIKEITQKIKKLQNRLSEVMSNHSLPEATKESRSQTINAQIEAAYAELAQVAKETTGEAEGEAEG